MQPSMQSIASRILNRRAFSSFPRRQNAYSPHPAPPRLPKEEQEIFEQLQKQSMGAFSAPRKPPQINQSPHSAKASDQVSSQDTSVKSTANEDETPSIRANVKKGDELHPNIRRGAAPEFQGDTNPETGEIGGPKNNPIRWKQMEGDWSFNGRVSDF